jgi:hypothetical protein
MSGIYINPVLQPYTLDPKYVGESKIASIDFSNMLIIGELLVAIQNVSMCVTQGVDPNPSGLLSGVPTIIGNVVNQLVAGGVAETVYNLSISVKTNRGQILTGVVQFPVLDVC